MRKRIVAIAAAIAIWLPALAFAHGRTAAVNGLTMYYEVHATGRPLVLLHGALTTIDTSFGKMQRSYSGAASGKGAAYEWEGDNDFEAGLADLKVVAEK